MIHFLNRVIRRTLIAEIPSLSGRIGFQPPDRAWQDRVTPGTGTWVNCALVDLREDRTRRSNEPRIEQHPLRRVRPPFLLTCHYLLSAWNGAAASDQVFPTREEHEVLGNVVAALVERTPLTPAAVLLPGELTALPHSWQEASFATELLPPEGFGKIPEFWGTMGRTAPWRPVIWLAVTVPVDPRPSPVDGIVTTVITSIRQGADPDVEETLLTVGGRVVDATSLPVQEALVTLTDAAGHLRGRASTDDEGRFVLDGLPPGSYRLAARVPGRPAAPPHDITLPEPTPGPYTVQLT
ncbi:MAG: Pvc16 family protein [Propionibacteriaceae bacterium]